MAETEASMTPPTVDTKKVTTNGHLPPGLTEDDFKMSPEVKATIEAWKAQPKKTADELVAEIMSGVSDEGVKESFAKMDKLHEELTQKVMWHTT